MKKQKKHYTPEEKVAILRRHLVEGVPISDLCDELGLQPTAFRLENNPARNIAVGWSYFRVADLSPGRCPVRTVLSRPWFSA
jgi:hypothetical protein